MDLTDLPRSSKRHILISRQREQAILRRQQELALAGQGTLVLISGEAGIGKTTLAEDLARDAAADGMLVLWGHAYDLTVTPPYGPWLEILRSIPELPDGPPLPDFVQDATALARIGNQDALFGAVIRFFGQLAEARPLLLILDDLHWADQASLDFLRTFARQLADRRILLVATYRSDELHRQHPLYALLPLLTRESNAGRLDVHPLDAAGHRALINSQYTLQVDDQGRLEDYLNAHAEGNPLYAGELLRSLEEEGILTHEPDGWRLGDVEQLRVPPLLRQVIERRLRRLSQATRELLQIGAVIGQEVPLDLWQQVCAASDDALAVAIEEGRRAYLIDETPSRSGFRFHHALLREALYDEVSTIRRRAWHRRVAEVLAETPDPDPDAVAHHFQQAGDDRASDWLIQAGDRAHRTYAWITAAARFEAALIWLDERGAAVSTRAVLLCRIAYLQRYVDPRRSLALMVEAHRLAVAAGEAGLAAECRFLVGVLRAFLGDNRGGITDMEAAAGDFRALSPIDQARRWTLLDQNPDAFAGALVVTLVHAGRLDEAVAVGERILAEIAPPVLRAGQGESRYADCLAGLAEAYALRGKPRAALTTFHRAETIYRAIEQHGMLALSCGLELDLVLLPYLTDDREARRRLIADGEAAARRAVGATSTDMGPWQVATGVQTLEGDWNAARMSAAAAYENDLAPTRLPLGAPWLALIAREQGDVATAWRIIADVLPDGANTEPETARFWVALMLQRLAADMARDAGDLVPARAWLEAHDRWLGWSGAVLGHAAGALGWAKFHGAQGNQALAHRHAERALAHASDPRQPVALMAVHRLLGQLDTGARCFDEAEAHLCQSLELADACGASFERALTLHGFAELRAAEGRFEEAQTLLTETRQICEPLEAWPTLARIDALETKLASSRTPRRKRYPAGLTAREVEVLRLVADGLSDAEVAERLYVSRRTVNTHLTAIYGKLNVSSRASATRFAVEHGLV